MSVVIGADSRKTKAQWFAQGGGRQAAAQLWFADGAVWAQNDKGESRNAAIGSIKISSRMAGLPRRLVFPDGIILVVEDNDFVDAGIGSRASAFLHKLEANWRWLVAAFGAAGFAGWAIVVFALPAASTLIAERVSPETLTSLSEGVYAQIADSGFLAESKLPPHKQAQVQQLFLQVIGDDDDFNYRLHFHRMQFDMANAFALPDGMIVASDKLIAILNERELAAVFAHEIAHIRRRHGLRLLMESSAVFVLSSFALGDISFVLSGGAALLIQQKYSRDFEREADCDAYAFLRARGEDEEIMAAALAKLEKNQVVSDEVGDNDNDGIVHHIVALLSSHPAARERIDFHKHCYD